MTLENIMFRVDIFYIAYTRLITLAPGVTRERLLFNLLDLSVILGRTLIDAVKFIGARGCWWKF
jgi:hypothetical protein